MNYLKFRRFSILSAYLFPIKVAILLFPILTSIICIPYAVYNYRKYGTNNKFKIFIFYTFVFYCITAFFMTLLPLPQVDEPFFTGSNTQLIPFTFIKDFLSETSVILTKPNTYLHIFSEPAFMQVFFNIVLTIPLGVYLRYYFKKSFKQTLLISFLVSMFFEVTQLTGIYGIYKYPYRLFDVDDLMINTLGGVIGYSITPLFKYILPDINIIKSKTFNKGSSPSYPKRILAFLIDWNICFFFFNEENIFSFIFITFIYFILVPYYSNGFTLGKYILKIKLKGPTDKLSFKQVFKRYGILLYGFFLSSYILNNGIDYLLRIEKYDFFILLFIIQILLNSFALIHLVSHIFKRNPILLHDKISHVENINLS